MTLIFPNLKPYYSYEVKSRTHNFNSIQILELSMFYLVLQVSKSKEIDKEIKKRPEIYIFSLSYKNIDINKNKNIDMSIDKNKNLP